MGAKYFSPNIARAPLAMSLASRSGKGMGNGGLMSDPARAGDKGEKLSERGTKSSRR